MSSRKRLGRCVAVALALAFALKSGVFAASARVGENAYAHVYVLDQAGVVFRYPFIDGVLASSPSSEITGLGLDPTGLAVAADGTVYARIYQDQVEVFAPGAQGNAKPMRVLNLPTGAYNLALDSTGYLYVATGPWGIYTGGVLIYAPGAGGDALPVATIAAYATNVAIGENGLLYVLNGWQAGESSIVSVYSKAPSNPTLIRQTCISSPNRSSTDAYGLAIGHSGAMYVGIDDSTRGTQQAVVGLPETADRCPATDYWTYQTIPPFQGTLGIAVLDKYLVVVDNASRIDELDLTMRKPQTPVTVVSGSPLSDPLDVTFGP